MGARGAKHPTGEGAAKKKKSPAKVPIEQYEHIDKKRSNNPPVGLVTIKNDPAESQKRYAFDPNINPTLDWAGKDEKAEFTIPTVSLHVHERIDPRTIIESVRKTNAVDYEQMSLFTKSAPKRAPSEEIDFYKHKDNWSNRLIAGDSLLVMNSLLEKEGMAGSVQMIYLDPPYGIKYKSNFQPFTSNRNVSDADKDDELTQEPETLQAFRDTWELGIHSYLTYLRDRLLLCRELLNESGSVFVQISDENVHIVRNVLDDVFGVDCFMVTIPLKKKGSQKSALMDPVNDYLLWYTKSSRIKNASLIKYKHIFEQKPLDTDTISVYKFVELEDGREFTINELTCPDGSPGNYSKNPEKIFADYPRARLFKSENITSGGDRKNQSLPFKYDGRTFHPGSGNCWKTTARDENGQLSGMSKLALAGRLIAGKNQLRYKGYLDDFGFEALSNWWDGLGGAANPIYVVQTNPEIIKRCMLMTTDPGDLILDPTCGSGTSAAVAEEWGRRWITCDTSRVAITLAKQRLMTSDFDYFDLLNQNEGVSSGFQYKRAPHITLGSIANNPEIRPGLSKAQIRAAIDKFAPQEILCNYPVKNGSKARVTGPFTVEAVPAATVKPLTAVGSKSTLLDGSIARAGETVRQREWLDELISTGIRAKGKQRISLAWAEPMSGTRWLHARGETTDTKGKQLVVSFGPANSTLDKRQVELALEEVGKLHHKPEMLVFAGFQFDPEAARIIDSHKSEKLQILKVQMTSDLLSEDLKRKKANADSFWLMGQPDVSLTKIKSGPDKGKFKVSVNGFDYYNVKSGAIVSGNESNIAMWMLDTDYDDRSVFPRQVFFPLAEKSGGWAKLAKSLKTEIDEELIESFSGTESLPFVSGKHKQIAVKIVDDRGIESIKLIKLENE
jgi:adenine-specific DNA-methyltransferase